MLILHLYVDFTARTITRDKGGHCLFPKEKVSLMYISLTADFQNT